MLNFIWHCAGLKKTNHEGSLSNRSNLVGIGNRMRFLVPGVHVYRMDWCSYHRDDYSISINLFIHKQMMWKITYKFKGPSGWQLGYKTLKANSPEDAIRLADMWPKLIKKVERI